jgi:chorismate dehydratase
MNQSASRPPRIAASDYLNSAPLIYSFQRGAQRDACELLPNAAPARCADMLRTAEVDAALIPAIEYQRIPELRIAPGVAVASKRRVGSVALVSRVPRPQIRTVGLDTSSRTSVSLVRILFAEFYRQNVDFSPAEPDIAAMLERHDAAVIIGDPAMTFQRTGRYVYDLAEEWRACTGLPFVFALWAVRESRMSRLSGVNFAAARDEGLAHRTELAERYGRALGLTTTDLVAYLTENICYDLDDENLAGLARYYELAAAHGLIEGVRPLAWL